MKQYQKLLTYINIVSASIQIGSLQAQTSYTTTYTAPGNTMATPVVSSTSIPTTTIPSLNVSAPSIQAPVMPMISTGPSTYVPQVYSATSLPGVTSFPTSIPTSNVYTSPTVYNNYYAQPQTASLASYNPFDPYALTPSTVPVTTFSNPPVSPVQQAPILNQLYPQPANPQVVAPGPMLRPGAPLQLSARPFQFINPPLAMTPGLATIRDGNWVVSDFFYNLPFTIGLKVEILRPAGNHYIPLSETLITKRLTDILANVGISTLFGSLPCEPPLPFLNVIIMAYPCDRRCIGFITVQLLEPGQPRRIDIDLNGVWQVVTWERQLLVASSCDDFSHEVGEMLDVIVSDFTNRFHYYHPADVRPCFPAPEY